MFDLGVLLQEMHKPSLHWPKTFVFWRRSPSSYRYRSGSQLRYPPKRRSSVSDIQDVTALQKSFNPLDAIHSLRRHRWRITDVQYAVLAGFFLFSMAITPPAPLVKLLATTAVVLVLSMPVTRQFFLPSLPLWLYLFYFFSSRFIPVEYRPHIWVRVLPALENVLYGANLSAILSAHTHPVLDLLAWFPYGLGHFGAPAVCSLAMFFLAAPGTTPVFIRSIGWLGCIGVTLQLVLPCTPPWYELEHGLSVPAAYGMSGSPAGLARVDKILGVDMYTTSFTTAPLPFGAFPSLHAADAIVEALFMSYCFPRLRPLFIAYVGWMWWATMYLGHHYAVDLVGGSLIGTAIFYFARARYLPRPQEGKTTRWQYEFVEHGERKRSSFDEEEGGAMSGTGGATFLGLGLLRNPDAHDSDEWTIRSSSSSISNFASSSEEGESSGSSGSSGRGSWSPSLSEGGGRPFAVDMTGYHRE